MAPYDVAGNIRQAVPQSETHPKRPNPGYSLGETQTLSPHSGSPHAGRMDVCNHSTRQGLAARYCLPRHQP